MTSIEASLEWVLEKLAGVGFGEAIVVDLTQTQIEIPVVHVTVPGAEGIVTHAGYTPGPRMQALLAERS
jgi:ribosomal protein S12 methylthiotransferase accessory factor YcaO